MSQRLPLIAVLLGVAGLIPFVGCGLAALGPDDAQARTAMLALTGYGAVILAFLGGVHWGFALAPSTAEQSARALSRRLLLGVVPSLIGWLALLTVMMLPAWVALCILIAGFIATAGVEGRAARRGFVPAGYMWLRWGLTAAVVVVLALVLALRLLGIPVLLL